MSARLATSAAILRTCVWFFSVSALLPAAVRADPSQSSADDIRSAAALHGAAATDPDHAGIWKDAIPPPGTTRGEFDDNDPVGLSAGERIEADCSINWVNPDSGKRYCFSTATSLVSFLQAPHQYLSQAEGIWNHLKSAPATPGAAR